MSFNGTWQVYSQENYEAFLRAVGKYVHFMAICGNNLPLVMVSDKGLPEEVVKIAKDINPVIEIQQDGDNFVVTSKTPKQSVTNSFTIGKEAEITTMNGKKMKCTVVCEGGKLVSKTDQFSHIQEVKGNEMVETLTVGSATLVRRSKKV